MDLEAIQKEGCILKMESWHGKDGHCGTTHCRVGWVTHLAGEAGKALEGMTSTEFAAKQIYKASSPIRVSPNQFFANNERAMEDIIRCANEEKALAESQK